MKTAYLGLGTNLGDRLANLAAALRGLAADPGLVIVRGSSVYESKPVGVLEQPDFLNMVVLIETTLAPAGLLQHCHWIEAQMGRERRERWGPRLIDLDLLAYEDVVSTEERLVLPHPRMHERSFVLTPLAEIAPEFSLNHTNVCDLAAQVGEAGLSRLMSCEDFSQLAGFPWRLP